MCQKSPATKINTDFRSPSFLQRWSPGFYVILHNHVKIFFQKNACHEIQVQLEMVEYFSKYEF